MSFHAAQSFTFGEQPSATKWNYLWENDYALADGSAIAADAIKASQLFKGLVFKRQGGASGDADWGNPGTTNVATDAKDVIIQGGAKTIPGSAGTDTAVTFGTAYTYQPLVFVMPQTQGGANLKALVNSVTTTGFNIRSLDTGGAGETCAWLAVGQ